MVICQEQGVALSLLRLVELGIDRLLIGNKLLAVKQEMKFPFLVSIGSIFKFQKLVLKLESSREKNK
jgi:hypothetical protein